MQLNGGNFFFRFGKYILLAYGLLGFVIVNWSFHKNLSFLEATGVVLYVAGSVALVIRAQNVRRNYSLTKSDKAKIIRDILWIAICFAAAFVVMVVGTLANPKTKAGFIMFFEIPIVILIFIIVALITRISYVLLLKRYFNGKFGNE